MHGGARFRQLASQDARQSISMARMAHYRTGRNRFVWSDLRGRKTKTYRVRNWLTTAKPTPSDCQQLPATPNRLRTDLAGVSTGEESDSKATIKRHSAAKRQESDIPPIPPSCFAGLRNHDPREPDWPSRKATAKRHSSSKATSNATFRIPASCFAGLQHHDCRAKGTQLRQITASNPSCVK